jgi:hypothetical protein
MVNRYHPPIQMQGATVEVAREMLRRSRTTNVVQGKVEIDNLRLRNGQWQRLGNQVPNFPRLDLDYLRDLTIGIYQINLSPSYIQDKLICDRDDELQIDMSVNEDNFIRVRVYSRFRNAIKHQIFIAYVNEEEVRNEKDNFITGYYCTCQSGPRTLGTCAHVASILWYLGYACHRPNIEYPDDILLNTTMDVGQRNN